MTVRVDFIFDVVCPYAYLAHTQVEQLCEGVELSWQPILLGVHNAIIARAPLEEFLHRTTTLDTLGTDIQEADCPRRSAP